MSRRKITNIIKTHLSSEERLYIAMCIISSTFALFFTDLGPLVLDTTQQILKEDGVVGLGMFAWALIIAFLLSPICFALWLLGVVFKYSFLIVSFVYSLLTK